MHEKNTLLFCATFVTIIISSVYTKQQWSIPYYTNNCRKPYGTISHLNKPSTVPVVSSQKIDVAIDKGIKPIYWSTLLPTPVETSIRPETNKNYQIYDNVDQQNLGTVINTDYFANLLLNYMNYIITPGSENRLTNQLSTNKPRVYKLENTTRQKSKGNKDFLRRNYCKKKNKIQVRNKNKKKKNRIRKKNNRCNHELERNYINSYKLPDENCYNKPVLEKSCEIVKIHPQHDLSPEYQELESVECKSQIKKPKRPKKDSGSDPQIIDAANKDLITENNIEEKVTSFDQICTTLDDELNINLEYSDHDCNCIRNSRNNESYKKTRKNYSNPPNSFATDYLNIIYNHMPNHQFGSIYPDNSYVFPYNFDYLYQLPQSQNKKESTKGSKDKNPKSSQKSSKKGSNKKASSKKRKKGKSDKQQTSSDNVSTVVELTPTLMTIDLTEEVPCNIDSIITECLPDLNSAEQLVPNEQPMLVPNHLYTKHVIDVQKNIGVEKNDNFEDISDITSVLDEIHNRQEDTKKNNYEYMPQNSLEDMPKTNQDDTLSIQNKPQNIQNYMLENSHGNSPENSKEILSITEDKYENPYGEEFIIPLLPDDIYFWDDYYPDFTFENGAYITSSEEDEWVNFHKYYYFNDLGTKEVLKRNLNKRPKPKFDWTIHSQPHSEDELKISVSEFPNFITKIVNKEDIPHYKDVLFEKSNKKTKLINDNKINSNYKMKDVETVHAPSRVRNYSFKPSYDDTYDSSEEESRENNLYKREGDLFVVYSSPFVID